MLELQAASPADIPLIRELARRIWNDCYPGIIPQEQIDFMLGWMYGASQLEHDMTAGGVSFFLLLRQGQAIGFAALGPGPGDGELHLHKLYLETASHGRGLGSEALARLKCVARERGATRLSLRVNRQNERAIRCYRRNGFAVERQVVSEIGGGFVMDDHWMAAAL